ncbi:hypothetical protein BDN72DRAFT_847604 [Pluteus cervinus]|uniref:Uncharacterized protein n=1 Tax=Pluteus cervinus TaxID=181527 RepID=A0ACD3ADC1_9AGAR|nr:hypothetical protein BDN72DRAFT_847604 [Pluteus cervinus]
MSFTHSNPILTQHFDTSETAFAKIDKEIAGLREGIRALYAFRNTFTPVYRLPPEIFTYIFSYVQDVPGQALCHRNRSCDWLVVASVSQHWRNTALRSPTLWVNIRGDYSKHIVELWLQRSKAAPLSIGFIHNIEHGEFFWTSLFRIRELKLSINPSAWNYFWSKLSSPAPLLESLSLFVSGTSQPHLTISPSAFAGTTPRLRRLELTGCTLDPDSPICKDLTTLELSCYGPIPRIGGTELLTLLQKLPRLTSLNLFLVLRDDATLASSDFHVVSLPYLASLSILGSSSIQDFDLISHLSFPATTALQLSTDTRSEDPIATLSDFLGVYNSARRPEPADSSPNILRSADLQCGSHDLKLLIRTRIEGSELESVTNLLEFKLLGPGQWTSPLEISYNPGTVTLLSALHLSTLTSFTTNCDIDVETWTNVFGTLRKLKHISVCEVYSFSVLSAIMYDFQRYMIHIEKSNKIPSRPPSENPSASTLYDWTPIFPQVEHIEVEETDFPDNILHLMDALRARKIAGKGIKKLGITTCGNVNRAKLVNLEDSVDDIVWDGWMDKQAEMDDR